MAGITMKLGGRVYSYDGQKWLDADSTRVPVAIEGQLMRRLLPDQILEARMEARRTGIAELRHFLGCHNPDVMGTTGEECDGLGFLTNKDFGDPVADVLWFVARSERPGRYSLKSFYVIERDTDGGIFKHRYEGSPKRATVFDPMLELTHLKWFQEYYPTTQYANGLGMDVIKPGMVHRFIEVAATAGKEFRY